MLAAGSSNPNILTQLINPDSSIHAVDEGRNTALILAVIGTHVAAARRLLEHGADRVMRKRNRDNATEIAQRSMNPELIGVIDNAGTKNAWIAR